jgi:hypothetical protein
MIDLHALYLRESGAYGYCNGAKAVIGTSELTQDKWLRNALKYIVELTALDLLDL